MSLDVKGLTLEKVSTAFREGDFSAEELAKAYLSNIKKDDSGVHAYLEVFDDAVSQAKEADKRIRSGKGGMLTGVPIALKDNIMQKGRAITAGSRILHGHTALYDATVVGKLKERGTVFLGRANLDEFAMGSSTEHSAFNTTHNPHDKTRVPGGSSGGPAAAVAGNMALFALGSDTGGSLRQPASFCGVVGLKPTYGSVSRYGLIAMGSSLDVIGPITKTVRDAELVYEAVRGLDTRDSTSRMGKEPGKKFKQTKYTLGVPRHFFKEGIDKDVLLNFEESLSKLQKAGYEVKEIELPRIKHALAAYYIIMPAEASTNLARYDGVRFGLHKSGEDLQGDYKKTRGSGFGEEVRLRILLGTYVLSAGYYDAYYHKAMVVRGLITEDFDRAFREVNLVLTPTTPTPAFKIGEKSDPLAMYLSDIFTVPANLTGMPALSVPSGTVKRDGVDLPVGLQLMGPHFGESMLFEVGKAFLGE